MGRKARRGNQNDLARKLGVSRPRITALKKAGKLGPVNHEIAIQMHKERLAAQQRSPSRQVKDLYDAKMAKLQFEKAAGELIEVAKVKQAMFERGRQVRDAILSISDRLSGILAAETDQSKVHAILTKELHQALEALTQ